MTSSRSILVGTAILAATVASGCVGKYTSDFPVVVVNRTANTIEALANGKQIGEIAAAQSASFTLTLEESNANTFSNGTAPTPQAQVTFSAKDTKTGTLSSDKSVTLTQSSPTTVAFEAGDFPDTGPTIARFTYSPTNPTINQDVSLNASSSTVHNGTFAWDFGDGQSGTGETVTHRYTRGGTFTITLTVTSDMRATSTSSRTVTVSATLAASNANFTFSPTNPGINQNVVFTSSTGGGGFPGGGPPPGGGAPGGGGPGGGAPGGTGAIIGYAWDFGDGTSGQGATVTHQYARGGTYTVTLRVTTDTGLSASMSRSITVSATLPSGSADFTFSPTDPLIGDSVYFNASSSTSSGSFSWDFGDGSSGSGVTTTHQYSAARTYTVTLTVVTSQGQTATASKTITVSSGN
jgi:PKD repeat protein